MSLFTACIAGNVSDVLGKKVLSRRHLGHTSQAKKQPSWSCAFLGVCPCRYFYESIASKPIFDDDVFNLKVSRQLRGVCVNLDCDFKST